MGYRLRFKIAGLPKMANGGHGSWQRDAAEKKKWKLLVAKELVGRSPGTPFDCIVVKFIRHSATEPDFDGLVHGFKSIRDALVKFGLVVDDKNKNMRAEYLWKFAPRGKGHIEVEVEEVAK